MNALLAKSDGFTTLPVTITITGTMDDYRYGVKARIPSIVEQAGGLLKNVIDSIAGENATGNLKDSLGGVLKGLLGPRKSDDD